MTTDETGTPPRNRGRVFDKPTVDAMVAEGSFCNEYKKVATTRAVRVEGPFTVDTHEGPLTCQDGWVALDSRGWPYPIAAEDFDAMYAAATG